MQQRYGPTQTVRRTVLPFVPGLPGYTYTNAEAAAYVAAMTSVPNDTRKALIDTLVGALKSAGVWATLDVLTLMAAHDSQAATLNLVAPSKVWTPTNSPVFTTDRGFAGDAVSKHVAYVDTYAALTNYTQADGAISVGVRSVTRGATSWVIGANGASSGSGLLLNTTLTIPRINNTAAGNGPDPTVSAGRFTISRAGGTAVTQFLNGSSQGTAVTATVAKSTNQPSTHRNNTGFSDAQISYVSIGASMTPTQAANFDAAISAYLTAIGA